MMIKSSSLSYRTGKMKRVKRPYQLGFKSIEFEVGLFKSESFSTAIVSQAIYVKKSSEGRINSPREGPKLQLPLSIPSPHNLSAQNKPTLKGCWGST